MDNAVPREKGELKGTAFFMAWIRAETENDYTPGTISISHKTITCTNIHTHSTANLIIKIVREWQNWHLDMICKNKIVNLGSKLTRHIKKFKCLYQK